MPYRPRHASEVPFARTRTVIFFISAFTWPGWAFIRDVILDRMHWHTRIDDRISTALAIFTMLATCVGLGLYRGAHEIMLRQMTDMAERVREWDRIAAILGRTPPDGGRPLLQCLDGGRKAS